MLNKKAKKLAEKFLATGDEFQLGDLPTERRHPKTKRLAELSRENPLVALKVLKEIDLSCLGAVLGSEKKIAQMARDIKSTFASGGRVFFYGCGATGRLALSLEYIWRHVHRGTNLENNVYGFMSGGDLALVHSIENFEDHPEYGARQVRDVGFGKNDLLISCTEGGETPSVIGATEAAVKISNRPPWFLYCNPDEILKKKVKRSRRVLENKNINKICLYVGPMSLSGSTRLQATTALQMAAGSALFGGLKSVGAENFLSFLKKKKYDFLTPFIEEESKAYEKGQFLLYETEDYAITITTDTTERSPTFSLPGFENQKEPASKASMSYVIIPSASSAEEAWNKLLLRAPRTIEWPALKGVASKRRLLGFDFSKNLKKFRKKKIMGSKQHVFKIHRRKLNMCFSLGRAKARVDIGILHPLCEHLFLKMLLNAHSTLVMGRMGRYESNVMIWVKPSNNKLVDRAIRYVNFLLTKKQRKHIGYKEIAFELFQQAGRLPMGESVVLNTLRALTKK